MREIERRTEGERSRPCMEESGGRESNRIRGRKTFLERGREREMGKRERERDREEESLSSSEQTEVKLQSVSFLFLCFCGEKNFNVFVAKDIFQDILINVENRTLDRPGN